MDILNKLYNIAEQNDITVENLRMTEAEAFCLPCGEICIDYAKITESSSETVKLAHELGHVFTGSFYTAGSSPAARAAAEGRADVWAIKTLVPKDRLLRLSARGYLTCWEVAAHFNITEEFAEKALRYYNCILPPQNACPE